MHGLWENKHISSQIIMVMSGAGHYLSAAWTGHFLFSFFFFRESGEGREKKNLPQMGYESTGAGRRGVTNMISISFSGIKMLWLWPPLLPLTFSSTFHHHQPKNADMQIYGYAEMPSVKFFCGNAHRHLIIRKYKQMHIDIWEVF